MRFFILACSVCFADPHSAAAQGLLLAVLFLMGVVGAVLTGIAAAIFVWTRRAREIESNAPPPPA